MKTYIINYYYDHKDYQYVAVCPQFFGFICYGETFNKLNKQCIKLLKIYSKDKYLSGDNITFNEYHAENIQEVELGG